MRTTTSYMMEFIPPPMQDKTHIKTGNATDQRGRGPVQVSDIGLLQPDGLLGCASDTHGAVNAERPLFPFDSKMSKTIDGFNMEKDGMTARTIKAQYYKTSAANFLSEGSHGATGVIEITPITTIGFYNERNGFFSKEVSGTVTTRTGRSQHEFIIEENEQ